MSEFVMQEEQEHLKKCKIHIKENIDKFQKDLAKSKKEHEELYDEYQAGNVELYDQLFVSTQIVENYQSHLNRNTVAYEKPYFGRVDYKEVGHGEECLYIGKKGVTKNHTEVVVADWRAPISSVYYDNSLGRGSYNVPDNEEVQIDLKLKRSYDIQDGKLIGYYDSDVATDDELLVKYLAKNKDVVLNDIISTIQKEQNKIIRESPYSNIVVQGVAGSGKTTVALHKISYVLYNYEHKYSPEDFCIIGSNDILLNYITSGLPELDVHNIGQLRMDIFLEGMVGGEWNPKYKACELHKDTAWRSSLAFVIELEEYIQTIREEIIPLEDVVDSELGLILSKSSIEEIINRNKQYSVKYIVESLNERIRNRVNLFIDKLNLKKDKKTKLKREKRKQFKEYYKDSSINNNVLEIYMDFLIKYIEKHEYEISDDIVSIQKGNLDVYDMAALVLIARRIVTTEYSEEYTQIIIDEAQDFGVMIYYVLHEVLPECIFTIMGDVSQNVNYDTGMNSWTELEEYVFNSDKDKFCVLSKSYRNTIEISEYAGQILEYASNKEYKIEPVIRHGREVQILELETKQAQDEVVQIIKDMKSEGYKTIAVVCKDEKTAKNMKDLMDKLIPEDIRKTIMVLPINLTKGLEFDVVILYKLGMESYRTNPSEAKLLYVAVTRALHELYVIK